MDNVATVSSMGPKKMLVTPPAWPSNEECTAIFPGCVGLSGAPPSARGVMATKALSSSSGKVMGNCRSLRSMDRSISVR